MCHIDPMLKQFVIRKQRVKLNNTLLSIFSIFSVSKQLAENLSNEVSTKMERNLLLRVALVLTRLS